MSGPARTESRLVLALECHRPLAAPACYEAGSSMVRSGLIDSITEHVDAMLRLGFEGVERAAESAIDIYGDDDGYPGDAVVHQLARERLQRLLDEQKSWSRPTDAERLATAFQRLNDAGILARHNYGPTRTWGRGDLLEEAAHVAARGMPPRGYVYYTSQDAEGLSDGSLFLAFGAIVAPGTTYAETAHDTHAIAEEIQRHLSQAGLAVDWDGGVDSAMLLRDLTWNCPRDGDGNGMLGNRPVPPADVPPRPREPRRLFGWPLTKDDELWVVVTLVACDGSNAADVALEVVYESLGPESRATVHRGPGALDLVIAGLALGGRPVRFDLVAAPANLLHRGRREAIEMADVVIAIVRDAENDFEAVEEVRAWLADTERDAPVVLLVDAPAALLVDALRASFPHEIVQIDFESNAAPVMTALEHATKLALGRIRVAAGGAA